MCTMTSGPASTLDSGGAQKLMRGTNVLLSTCIEVGAFPALISARAITWSRVGINDQRKSASGSAKVLPFQVNACVDHRYSELGPKFIASEWQEV